MMSGTRTCWKQTGDRRRSWLVFSTALTLTLAGCDQHEAGADCVPDVPAAGQMLPGKDSVGLREITCVYRSYLARLDSRTTISPTGLLRSEVVFNKSWGSNDLPTIGEQTEIRQGQLTPAQVEQLVELFADWDTLPDGSPGPIDGPEQSIRYGDRTIRGGVVPPQFSRIHQAIAALRASMPIVDHP